MVPLRDVVKSERSVKADRISESNILLTTALFVPEYAGSKVTTRLEDQTVKPRAIHVLEVDSKKTSPRFLAFILNSDYGRELRWNAAQGATIQRISFADLLSLNLPIPPQAAQNELTKTEADISLLQAMLSEMRNSVARDWTQVNTVMQKIDEINSTIDLEHKINDWWRELPYPLATIYRRYRIETDPKERLETLLHFFEVAAILTATMATSFVRALRPDWEPVLGSWMHPERGTSVERADFGFWSNLASTGLKELRRIISDSELRSNALAYAGSELLSAITLLVDLSKGFGPIDVARECRNSWIGHGGFIKAADAERIEVELRTQLRAYYEIASPVFRRLWLVKPGDAAIGEDTYKYKIQKLLGSDPLFAIEVMEVRQRLTSKVLAFWLAGSQAAVKALPFLRLGTPQRTTESSLYVFNRVDKNGYRWVSYQETQEQEIFVEDEELASLLALKIVK